MIAGMEPHVGAVTFADKVDEGGHGIVNANADQTFAKVTPSYTTKLTVVLDLQDPKTGQTASASWAARSPARSPRRTVR